MSFPVHLRRRIELVYESDGHTHNSVKIFLVLRKTVCTSIQTQDFP
jgi:hypothetical protein